MTPITITIACLIMENLRYIRYTGQTNVKAIWVRYKTDIR